MSSNTAIALIVVTFLIVTFGAMSLREYEQNQTKIACYEAAKTNTNLKCQ
jgi:hypothetical protein